MHWHEPIALGFAALPAVPLAVLAGECAVALVRRPTARPAERTPGARCAVLIPAHNEESGLARTLDALQPQLAPGDRVLVVADNCTDATASIARAHGVGVVERFDAVQRGKGYALARGVEELAPDPPDIVVILDADCVIEPGALATLVNRSVATGRPVQAAYLMDPPAEPNPRQQVAAFAFLVKNVVRPLGLSRLGLPCLLTGTGMAFPWATLRAANLGHGHIVEDMQLAVDLAASGRPVAFEPAAVVRSQFPADDAATASQRKRWEHGHLSVLTKSAPRLIAQGVLRGRPKLIALGLEIGVPPLSALLLGAAVGLLALVGYGVLSGNWLPSEILFAVGSFAVLTLLGVWLRYGRAVLPAQSLASVPWYALRKLVLYAGFLVRPQSEWVKTRRTPTGG